MLLVFISTILLKVAKLQYFALAPFCQTKRVTDEAYVAETAVWPITFLISMLTALKGSQFYFLYPVGTGKSDKTSTFASTSLT